MEQGIGNESMRGDNARSALIERHNRSCIFLGIKRPLTFHQAQKFLAGFGKRNGFDPGHMATETLFKCEHRNNSKKILGGRNGKRAADDCRSRKMHRRKWADQAAGLAFFARSSSSCGDTSST